jgi:hypothetical protein
MSDLPIKSVVLKGNLRDNLCTLDYSLSTEDKSGLYQVCVRNILYENKSIKNINHFALINCNLVKDVRQYQYSTQVYLPSIANVLFKATPTEKKIVNYENTWFFVNAPNDVIKISFIDPATEAPLNLNCEVFVTVLLRQQK